MLHIHPPGMGWAHLCSISLPSTRLPGFHQQDHETLALLLLLPEWCKSSFSQNLTGSGARPFPSLPLQALCSGTTPLTSEEGESPELAIALCRSLHWATARPYPGDLAHGIFSRSCHLLLCAQGLPAAASDVLSPACALPCPQTRLPLAVTCHPTASVTWPFPTAISPTGQELSHVAPSWGSSRFSQA